MKIFPETEAYAISYIPGTAGSFLCMLVAEFSNILEKSDFSKNGNAHVTRVGSNQVNDDDFDTQLLAPGQLFSRFLETIPKDTSQPIILAEHYPIDAELFFKKYPKGKILYIQIDPIQDRLLIETNFYFKVQVDSYHEIPFWHQLWEQESPIYFNGAKDPFDPNITDEMIVSLIQHRVEKNKDTTMYPFRVTDVVDIPNVLTCSFNDILTDRNKILNIISKLTNRPIPNTAYEIYDKYLEAQKPINDFIKSFKE